MAAEPVKRSSAIRTDKPIPLLAGCVNGTFILNLTPKNKVRVCGTILSNPCSLLPSSADANTEATPPRMCRGLIGT